MKLHLSVPDVADYMLAIVLPFGCVTGTLWPVHRFLLNFFDRVYRNTVRLIPHRRKFGAGVRAHSMSWCSFAFWGLPANYPDRTGELTWNRMAELAVFLK